MNMVVGRESMLPTPEKINWLATHLGRPESIALQRATEARTRLQRGVAFLNQYFPGWRVRIGDQHVSMSYDEECFLARACEGVMINGVIVESAGNVVRAFKKIGINLCRAEFGFYTQVMSHGLRDWIDYDDLQAAAKKILAEQYDKSVSPQATLTLPTMRKSSLVDSLLDRMPWMFR